MRLSRSCVRALILLPQVKRRSIYRYNRGNQWIFGSPWFNNKLLFHSTFHANIIVPWRETLAMQTFNSMKFTCQMEHCTRSVQSVHSQINWIQFYPYIDYALIPVYVLSATHTWRSSIQFGLRVKYHYYWISTKINNALVLSRRLCDLCGNNLWDRRTIWFMTCECEYLPKKNWNDIYAFTFLRALCVV